MGFHSFGSAPVSAASGWGGPDWWQLGGLGQGLVTKKKLPAATRENSKEVFPLGFTCWFWLVATTILAGAVSRECGRGFPKKETTSWIVYMVVPFLIPCSSHASKITGTDAFDSPMATKSCTKTPGTIRFPLQIPIKPRVSTITHFVRSRIAISTIRIMAP